MIIDIVKNLILDKTCDNCHHRYGWRKLQCEIKIPRSKLIKINNNDYQIDIEYVNLKPKEEKTCRDWIYDK
jgi:hypothetical protein